VTVFHQRRRVLVSCFRGDCGAILVAINSVDIDRGLLASVTQVPRGGLDIDPCSVCVRLEGAGRVCMCHRGATA